MNARRLQTQADGEWLLTSAIFIGASLFYMTIAVWFDRLGGFSYIDTIANADAMWYLRGFIDGSGTGTSWGPRSLIHPNVANLMHPIVSGTAQVLAALGVDPTPRVIRLIALGICPVAGGLEAALCHRLLRVRSSHAALLAILFALCFATTLFAAVPESFALTGLGMMLLFWHLQREETTGRISGLRGALIGAFLIGTTATNAVLFVLCLTVHRLARRQTTLIVRPVLVAVVAGTLLTAIVAVALAGLSGRLGDYVLRVEQLHEAPILREVAQGAVSSVGGARAQSQRYVQRATRDVPGAIAYAFVPPPLSVVTTTEVDSPFHLTYQQATLDWRRIGGMLTLLALAVAVVLVRRRDALFLTALALLAYHWGFHTFFGEELLLYSRHWNGAVALLLTALVPAAGDARPAARWILVALLCAIAANTSYVIWKAGVALDAHRAAVTSGPPHTGVVPQVQP